MRNYDIFCHSMLQYAETTRNGLGMTLHVSLPRELETLVHREVESGMYGSASEVVREALRNFFKDETDLTAQELAWLREDMKQRQARIANGQESWVDGEAFFVRVEEKFE